MKQSREALKFALMIARSQTWVLHKELSFVFNRIKFLPESAIREQDALARHAHAPICQHFFDGGCRLVRQKQIYYGGHFKRSAGGLQF